MAVVRTPFGSFRASGKIAGALIAYKWNGLNCLRSYTKPRDPKTPAQLARRTLVANATNAYKKYLQHSTAFLGWNKLKTISPEHWSTYNHVVSNLIRELDRQANPSFATEFEARPAKQVWVDMVNVLDGTPGNESGWFQIYTSLDCCNWFWRAQRKIAPPGMLKTPTLPDPAGNIWLLIVKDTNRTGFQRIQLQS